jgi:hypothetical protein
MFVSNTVLRRIALRRARIFESHSKTDLLESGGGKESLQTDKERAK